MGQKAIINRKKILSSSTLFFYPLKFFQLFNYFFYDIMDFEISFHYCLFAFVFNYKEQCSIGNKRRLKQKFLFYYR